LKLTTDGHKASRSLSATAALFVLLVLCFALSWAPVSFLLYVKPSYRIVSYHIES